MDGLGPRIHVLLAAGQQKKDVDGRDEAGHDAKRSPQAATARPPHLMQIDVDALPRGGRKCGRVSSESCA
jgi:hypothetical protein